MVPLLPGYGGIICGFGRKFSRIRSE
ncbi:hypothetical protein A2U01_0102492, partial [Trifolium medium]|nr:hypothetical protein [Trifolium medium]